MVVLQICPCPLFLWQVIDIKKGNCLEGEQPGVTRTDLMLSSEGDLDEYCQYSVADQSALTNMIRIRAEDRARHVKQQQGLIKLN